MNPKKFISATLVAFIIVFLFDYLWYGVIFKDWWRSMMSGMLTNMSENPNIPLHAFGDLCFAALLAWIYPAGYKGGTPRSEGIMFGFMMGLVLALPSSIHMYDTFPVVELGCMNIIHGVLVGIIGGICVAMIYGSGKTPSAG